MLDLYTFQTSNGQRVAIMLEECGLPYRAHRVNLAQGEQRAPAFLALNPAGMIPVLVDPDGPGGAPITVAQSGAILLHLAAKTGRFLPQDARARAEALQWLFFAVSDCGPASTAIYYSSARLPDKSEANVRFLEERLLGLLRRRRSAPRWARVARRRVLAGGHGDLPDRGVASQGGRGAGDLPHLLRWVDAVGARPAVQRGLAAAN